MNKETAVKLFKLITSGKSIGVDAEGGVVKDSTDLGMALDLLGLPTTIFREHVGQGAGDELTGADGAKWKSSIVWLGAPAAKFLREWADALEEVDTQLLHDKEVHDLNACKDGAYLERNKLVALLSTLYPSGIQRTAIEGWSEDWHGCVYMNLPNGQASWHYHDSQAYLFAHLPPFTGVWDGHTTELKYERIMELVRTYGVEISGAKPEFTALQLSGECYDPESIEQAD